MRGASRIALAIVGAFAVLVLSHYQLLRLPFYWDELGQFVPAALDIYQKWQWVPHSAVPNVHPPGVMAYLALIWHLTGYSIVDTRVAMLLTAAAGLCAQWKLARVLSGACQPAWMAVLFLFCCPLFFAQAPMAQLDMPAMVFTTIALALYLEERYVISALVCCAAVMSKETALVAPGLFGLLLLRRRQIPEAFLFALPLIPLGIWLVVLKSSTGHLFGSPEFTDYNLFYPLHPVRLGLALLRRVYYLLIGSGHVIGTLALVVWWRRKQGDAGERWRTAGLFVVLHVAAITVLGGAVLERYLLPVLPVLYAAFGTAIWSLPPRGRKLATLALTLALLIACAVNPPYPFPMENNLAWTTFVTLQREASGYVEAEFPSGTIATTFPFAGGLRRPELGYVTKPLHVLEVNDFRAENLSTKVRGHADALVLYSVLWDPMHLFRHQWLDQMLRRFYGYVPAATSLEVPGLTGMRSAFRLCAAEQCVEVFRTVGHPGSTRVDLRAPAVGNEDGGSVVEKE